MSFAVPWLSYVAAACPVVLAMLFAIDFTRRRRVLESVADAATLGRMLRSLSVRRRVLKAILLVVATTLLVAALARPQVPGESTWRRRGIDLALVFDFSKSMLARDVRPSRLDRAVAEAAELIDRDLPTSRVATVLFAGSTDFFPLTHDHQASHLLFEGVTPADLAPGSDLAMGVRTARCLLRPDQPASAGCRRHKHGGTALEGTLPLRDLVGGRDGSERARAMVVFTDGGDVESDEPARAELTEALEADIEVYFVAVGTRSGELIPGLDQAGRVAGWLRDTDGEFVTTRVNTERMKRLSDMTGHRLYEISGRTFDGRSLGAALRTLKEGDYDRRVVREPRDVYHWLLFPAFMLFLIEATVRDRRRV